MIQSNKLYIILAILGLLLLVGNFVLPVNAASFPGANWPTATPESQGMSSAKLQAISSGVIGNAIVIRNGYQVWKWGNVSTTAGSWSSSVRSMLTTAYGIAITNGDIPGGIAALEKSVDSFPGSSYGIKGAIKHALSYTSLVDPPGSYWQYSSNWDEMYAVFKEITGKTVHDYNNAKLYPVLGGGPGFEEKPDILPDEDPGAVSSLKASVSQAARWGYLWLNNGNWNGKQLVDPRFVARTIQPGPDGRGTPRAKADTPWGKTDEGWQIHLYRTDKAEFPVPGCPKDLFFAAGGGGTSFIIVSPSLNLVVARRGSDDPDKWPKTWMSSICQAVTGGGGPLPGTPVCSPQSQDAQPDQTVNLSASNSTTTYSWSAPGGEPASGTDANFSTKYASIGTKTVTVTSNGKSGTCTVNVSSGQPPTGPPIITGITPTKAVIGEQVTVFGSNLTGATVQLKSENGTIYNISPISILSASELGFEVSSNISAGNYFVVVTTPKGTVESTQKLTITIGGSPFGTPTQPTIPTEGLATFGQLVDLIFTWSLQILGIVVFVMIFYAGFMWFTARGNTAQVNEARAKITNAVTGAIILLAAYIILYTINPDLVGGVLTLPGAGTSQQP